MTTAEMPNPDDDNKRRVSQWSDHHPVNQAPKTEYRQYSPGESNVAPEGTPDPQLVCDGKFAGTGAYNKCPGCDTTYSTHHKDCKTKAIQDAAIKRYWTAIAEAIENRSWIMPDPNDKIRETYTPLQWGHLS